MSRINDRKTKIVVCPSMSVYSDFWITGNFVRLFHIYKIYLNWKCTQQTEVRIGHSYPSSLNLDSFPLTYYTFQCDRFYDTQSVVYVMVIIKILMSYQITCVLLVFTYDQVYLGWNLFPGFKLIKEIYDFLFSINDYLGLLVQGSECRNVDSKRSFWWLWLGSCIR